MKKAGKYQPEGNFRLCQFLRKRLNLATSVRSLDQYTQDATVFHRKFLVAPNKKLGWDRCMGQQVPLKGRLESSSATSPDAHQLQLEVLNGAQTPKPQADSLTMLIPLLFWCNQDPRLAVPSVAIPYGQRQ